MRGLALYEHQDPRRGFHKDWNTLIYNYGRREVSNFLEANAHFWLERYHADGLRVDAVASMLYLDYSRNEGEWEPNRYGGRENLEAIEFIRRMNTTAYRDFPGAVTDCRGIDCVAAVCRARWTAVASASAISGTWAGCTTRSNTLSRIPSIANTTTTSSRSGLLYAWDENFILPISHDEVVHGKAR